MQKVKLEEKAEKLKNIDKKTKVVIIIGFIGMLIILLSELIPGKTSDSDKNQKSSSKISYDNITDDGTDRYKNQIEEELTNILEKIDGVGKSKVMITLEGTTEYIYAENLNDYNDKDGDKTSNKHENEVVTIDKNGEKQALVKKIIKPKISGAVIVCEGGGDPKINERVIKAVRAALNISSGKICVESARNQ